MVASDRGNSGIYMRANQLQLNGGTIRHATTEQDAGITHAKPGENGDFPNHQVDGSLAPATLTNLLLSGVTLCPTFTSGTTNYNATVGRDFEVTTITATPETGGTVSILPADSNTTTPGHQIALDRGTNQITITIAKSGAGMGTYTVTVDRAWADIRRVKCSSDPGTDGTYNDGSVIQVEVTFDAAVTVDTTDGTPHVAILVGNYYKNAVYSSIDASNRILTFSYTVIAGDSDQVGIEIDANSLDSTAGPLRCSGPIWTQMLITTPCP